MKNQVLRKNYSYGSLAVREVQTQTSAQKKFKINDIIKKIQDQAKYIKQAINKSTSQSNLAKARSFPQLPIKATELLKNRADDLASTCCGTPPPAFDGKSIFSLKNFKILKTIGKGSYGQVFLVVQIKIGFVCALKKIAKKLVKERNMEQYVINEIKGLMRLNHPNLNGAYNFFDDKQNIYILLEYMEDGNLYQSCNRPNYAEIQVKSIIKQISHGLKQLHEVNLTHKDLKLENILISRGVVKIGDFGCLSNGNRFQDNNGSPLYFSPQKLQKNIYTNKADIWSLGIITYQLLFQKHPFQKDITKFYRSRNAGKIQLPKLVFPNKISQEAEDFLKSTLCIDQQRRLSIFEVLKHPFLKKTDSDLLKRSQITQYTKNFN